MMRTLAFVALAATAGCSKKSGDSDAYTSTDGHFSVVMPKGAKAVESTHSDPNKLNGDVTWHDVKSDLGAYSVMYADFADAATAAKDVGDYQQILGDRISGTKDVDVSGHKGKELTMTISPTATMWLRIFSVDKREYRVAAGTKNDQPKAYAFLDSFKLTN